MPRAWPFTRFLGGLAAPLAWLNAIAFAVLAAFLIIVATPEPIGARHYVPVAQLMAWPLPLTSFAVHLALIARAEGRGVLVAALGMLVTLFGLGIGAVAVSAIPNTAPGPGPNDAGVAMAIFFIGIWFVCWLVLSALFTPLLSEFVILRKGQKSFLTLLGAAAFILSLVVMGFPFGPAVVAGLIAAWWALAGLALLHAARLGAS